jgi:zinc protease
MWRRGWAVGLVAAWLVGFVCVAKKVSAAEPGPPKKMASVEGITEYRLENGARILLFPDPSKPTVTVNMTVLVGSRHEGYGETGMAHLLEHMVFKGTPNHPDIVGEMKTRGARFNGSTNPDRTNYYETLSATDDNLEFAIALEADRLMNSYVRDADLKTEFSVVRNEFERGENSPERVLDQRMMATAFEWHNYGKSTIGNRSDIERVPIQRLQAFYKKFYQPDNVVVVVAGKIDEAKTLRLINKYFGSIPKAARTLEVTYTEEPAQDGERQVTLRRVGDTPLLGIAYHAPAAGHPDTPALQVLGSLLSTQPSGRLYKALVDTKKVTRISASSHGMHDPGTFEVHSDLPKGGNVDEVYQAILKVLEEVKEKGVTQEEVDRAKRQSRKSRELAAANTSRLALQLSQAIADGDWRLYFINLDRIEQVTPEMVQKVAAHYLTRSNRTVGYFLPTTQPERTPVPTAPDLATLVEGYKGRDTSDSSESFDVAPMAIEARIQRPDPIDGVKIALLPKKTRRNAVTVQLTLRFGDAESLKGLVDAAQFLGALMERATKHLNRQQLRDALDENVAVLTGSGGEVGTVTFRLTTQRAHLVPALDILRQVLREPTLPADELEVLKLQRIATLERGKTEPAALALNRLNRLTSKYPSDDVRYAPTIQESIDRLEATTIDRVRTLYNDYLGASHGELAVVGDFDPSEVIPVFGKMLSGWKSGKPYSRIERPYQEGIAAARETIVTPDKENALFASRLTMPVGEDHPDSPALRIGNFIFGGGSLASRLGTRLRQKEGLSYGAGSIFTASPRDARATLGMSAICNPKNLRKAVGAADEELARMLRDGVTEQELSEAKAGYTRQLEIARTNDGELATVLAINLELGRTMQHEADLEQAIRRLQVDEVNTAFRKHVDPAKLVLIGAGDVPADTVK